MVSILLMVVLLLWMNWVGDSISGKVYDYIY